MSKIKKAPTPGTPGGAHQLEEKRYFMTSRAAQPGQGIAMPVIDCTGLEIAS
jgi:hypothetical protein